MDDLSPPRNHLATYHMYAAMSPPFPFAFPLFLGQRRLHSTAPLQLGDAMEGILTKGGQHKQPRSLRSRVQASVLSYLVLGTQNAEHQVYEHLSACVSE